MLNITTLDQFILPFSDLYEAGERWAPNPLNTKSLEGNDLYFFCRVPKAKFNATNLPVTITKRNRREYLHISGSFNFENKNNVFNVNLPKDVAFPFELPEHFSKKFFFIKNGELLAHTFSGKLPLNEILEPQTGDTFLADLLKNKVSYSKAVRFSTQLTLMQANDCPQALKEIEVLYIGKSSLESRYTIIDRLKRHETIQKILATEHSESSDYMYALYLTRVNPTSPCTYTLNPKRPPKDLHLVGKHITLEYKHLLTLAEAAFINFFKPRYNSMFRENFPTETSAVVRYFNEREFGALTAELDTSPLGFKFFTNSRDSKSYHFVSYNPSDSSQPIDLYKTLFTFEESA